MGISKTQFDVVVVGAGIAGLTSATLLAQSGYRVALLESHDKPGGCAGYFDVPSKWGNFRFPVGATTAVGFEAAGLHREIFERLGVKCPVLPIDYLKVFLPDVQLNLYHDQEKWKTERRKLPGNRSGQEALWKLQGVIADAGWFALHRKPSLPLQNIRDLQRNLALTHPRLAPVILSLPFSIGEVMKWLRVDRDRAFCALVNLQLLITTQSLSHAAPLGNAMAGLDLWRHGAFHPTGGMGAIAIKMLEGFEKYGGTPLFSHTVSKVRRLNSQWIVETNTGEEFHAPQVVANVPIWNLRSVVDHPPKTEGLERRAGSGWGAVNIYAAIKEEAVPADFPLHAQVLAQYHHTPPFLKAGTGDDLFLSLSHPDDLQCAPPGWRALNISTHVRWQHWQNLSAEEYRSQKKWWRNRLLDHARIALPNLDANQGFVITATPSSWEEYTQRFGGSVGGAALTRRNANLRALPSRMDQGLHLVGDTTFPGQGTVACALSGLNAWRDIIGQ